MTARILEAAFDAVSDGKIGQAGLAALAASSGNASFGGEVESVIVQQGLSSAGMPELGRLHEFERAWASSYASLTSTAPQPETVSEEDGGFTPRVKPPKG